MDSEKISAEHFTEVIKANINNEKLSDKDFREFLRDTISIVEKLSSALNEVNEIKKIIRDEIKEVPNGVVGKLTTAAHFGNGEYFPEGTKVIMYNNIQDEYKNVCIEIPESTKIEKTFIVRFDKIDWF